MEVKNSLVSRILCLGIGHGDYFEGQSSVNSPLCSDTVSPLHTCWSTGVFVVVAITKPVPKSLFKVYFGFGLYIEGEM